MRLFLIARIALAGVSSASVVWGEEKVHREEIVKCESHPTFEGMFQNEIFTCTKAAVLHPMQLLKFCNTSMKNIGSGKWLGKKKSGKKFCPRQCIKSCDPSGVDKDIITCSSASEPTVCSALDTSITCKDLRKQVNKCTAIVAKKPGQHCIYDPNNCRNNIIGCNAGGRNNCRLCGFGDFEKCQFGRYEPEYVGDGKFNVPNTIDDVLGLPVQIDCKKFYKSLDKIHAQGCPLNAAAFQEFVENPGTKPNMKCPPRLHQLFMSFGVHNGYQSNTTRNSMGETWPKPGSDKKCEMLALGEEAGFGDAGELSTIEITAKTMAMRMLKPATYDFKESLVNCCVITGDMNNPTSVNCDRCDETASDTIENGATWKNNTDNMRVPYQYNVPSAAQPQLSSNNGQRKERVAKGMHGKGQSCLGAKFSFGPLKELYKSNIKEGEKGFIPIDHRVGLLDPKLADSDVMFDSLVRLSGNKNFTIKDVHDIRVRGFALKLFGVDTEFKKLDLEYNQLMLADIPSYDQPDNARYAFGDFDFSAEQELGSLDLLHVAVGSGEGFDNVPHFSTDSVENATNAPANIFVARNVESYYNGFVLGGPPAPNIGELTKVFQNPLEYIYGSSAALRLGKGGAMKLHWAVCPGESVKIKNLYTNLIEAFKDPNYFLTNLRHTIENTSEFKMCGYIQLQDNPCEQPIFDPAMRWLTSSINVFELTFPMQTVPDYNTFCDNTVYSPYRTILEHQPVGFVNRVRQAVYQYANQFRLILNNGVTETKIDGNPSHSIGQTTCPFGYTAIPKGTRPKYQGQPIGSASQPFVSKDGEIPPAQPDSSSGFCQTDPECQLPFGVTSTCQDMKCVTK